MEDNEALKLLNEAESAGIPIAHIAREAKVSRAAVYRMKACDGREPLYSTRTKVVDAVRRLLEARSNV